MIGSLRGVLAARSARGEVVVEVGGVGYRATVGPATMVALGDVGGTVTVHTHLHVREDALTLVPGVGPKTATRLLIELTSRLDLDGVADPLDRALVNGDGARSARADLREALGALGYQADEVGAVMRQLPAQGEAPDLLRTALRLLAAAR